MKGDRISKAHLICRIIHYVVLAASIVMLILTSMLINGGAV